MMQLSLNLDAKLVWACKDLFFFILTSQLYLPSETVSQVYLFWFLWKEPCLSLSVDSLKLGWKSWICLFGRLSFHEMVNLFLGEPFLCRFPCLFVFVFKSHSHMVQCISLVKFKLFQQLWRVNIYLEKTFAGSSIFELRIGSINNDLNNVISGLL